MDDPTPNPPRDTAPHAGVSRRSFIATLGASAAAASLTSAAEAARTRLAAGRTKDGPKVLGPDPVQVTLRINGNPMETTIEPATTLLEALRLNLGLTGSKEICDRGSCGGCSVLVDGKLTVACMMLALDAVGSEVTTIEGLAKGGTLDPVQAAFIQHDALQCGYCTPGLVMASRALLNANPKPTLAQIRSGLSGNICRCGTYTNVFNAVLVASGQQPVIDSKGA
ncbi:MAG: (2Fe-2S)-binding protein [Phycisphaeraceae bacterium]|nr:(2Fe-2S)-binding protein [Phycisphaeraceae bacterium]